MKYLFVLLLVGCGQAKTNYTAPVVKQYVCVETSSQYVLEYTPYGWRWQLRTFCTRHEWI